MTSATASGRQKVRPGQGVGVLRRIARKELEVNLDTARPLRERHDPRQHRIELVTGHDDRTDCDPGGSRASSRNVHTNLVPSTCWTWIIVASEPITDVDTTAADILQELHEALTDRGICLVFAEMKDHVRTKVERYEFTPAIGPDRFFPTLTRAIDAFRSKTGAEWQPPSA